MNYKELQIGNYVAHYGRPILVDAALLLRLSEIDAAQKTVVDITFIEITDEVMYVLGFKRYPWGFVRGDFLINTYKINSRNKSIYRLQVENGAEIPLEYVHQIQNLFRLAKQELSGFIIV